MLTIVRELYAYRALIQILVLRDVKARYRGSTLGLLWTLLNPLLHMLIYAIVFSVYLRVEMDNYAVFLLCGLLPWIWLTSSLLTGASSIAEGGQLLKKVYFPPQVLPAVSVIVNFTNFLLGLPVLLAMLVLFGLWPGLALFLLPLIIAAQFAFTLGLVLIVATMSVRYRDIPQILGHLLTFWFFLSPIVYPVTLVPERFRPFLALNPVTVFVSSYQDVLLRNAVPSPAAIATVVGFGTLVLWIGAQVFERFRHVCVEEI